MCCVIETRIKGTFYCRMTETWFTITRSLITKLVRGMWITVGLDKRVLSPSFRILGTEVPRTEHPSLYLKLLCVYVHI